MKLLMKYHGVKIFTLFTALLFAFSATAQEEMKVPDYKGYVNDFADVLSPAEADVINQKLRRFDDSTTTQIAVVIEKNLIGGDAYQRAMAFARNWGVGSKENQNGVVLYIATEDKQYFTVTSQATQGKLTDGIVGQIQRDFLVPNLRAGNYAAAVDQTVSAYMQALMGEFKTGAKKENVPGWGFFLVILVILIIIIIINNRSRGRGFRSTGPYWFPMTGWGGHGWGGGSSGGGGWGGFGGGGGFDGGGAGGSW